MDSNPKVLDYALREELIDLIDACLDETPNPSKYDDLNQQILSSEIFMDNFRNEDLVVLAHLLPGIGRKELSPDIIWDWYSECRKRNQPK